MLLKIFVLLIAISVIVCHDNKVIIDNFGGDCSTDSLAVYKVTLEGHWSRELFPKHYPENRPSAHFSKSFGISHNSTFNLFSIDKVASVGLKEFCESTDTNEWENEEISGDFIFDEFVIPKLGNPLDKIESRLFVQSNYSLISMVTKLIPSPDWFIGIDALQVSKKIVHTIKETISYKKRFLLFISVGRTAATQRCAVRKFFGGAKNF